MQAGNPLLTRIVMEARDSMGLSEQARDGGRLELLLVAQASQLGSVDGAPAALKMSFAFAALMPTSWRSRRRLASNSANTPDMSRASVLIKRSLASSSGFLGGARWRG